MSGKRSYDKDRCADGPVLAAARTIPSWSHVDIHPSVPSTVRKGVNELRQDCEQELEEFRYNCVDLDQQILGMFGGYSGYIS